MHDKTIKTANWKMVVLLNVDSAERCMDPSHNAAAQESLAPPGYQAPRPRLLGICFPTV